MATIHREKLPKSVEHTPSEGGRGASMRETLNILSERRRLSKYTPMSVKKCTEQFAKRPNLCMKYSYAVEAERTALPSAGRTTLHIPGHPSRMRELRQKIDTL